MPILMISGNQDPVGNYGKGVLEVYNKLKEKGCQVTLTLYEDGRQEVYYDILNWIKKIA